MVLPPGARVPFNTQLIPAVSLFGETATPATVAPAEATLPEPLNDHTIPFASVTEAAAAVAAVRGVTALRVTA